MCEPTFQHTKSWNLRPFHPFGSPWLCEGGQWKWTHGKLNRKRLRLLRPQGSWEQAAHRWLTRDVRSIDLHRACGSACFARLVPCRSATDGVRIVARVMWVLEMSFFVGIDLSWGAKPHCWAWHSQTGPGLPRICSMFLDVNSSGFRYGNRGYCWAPGSAFPKRKLIRWAYRSVTFQIAIWVIVIRIQDLLTLAE